jgi:hypothetical protein
MQMLAAAGARVTGAPPDFEVDPAHRPTPSWFAEQQGRAVKILDPLRWPAFLLEDPGVVVILLTRDPGMQALSQLKLLRAGGADVRWDRTARRALTSQLRTETQGSIQRLRQSGRPVLRLTFEYLLTHRRTSARVITEFLRPYAELDDRKMWPEIWRRPTDCLPDLLEAELKAMAPYLNFPV